MTTVLEWASIEWASI